MTHGVFPSLPEATVRTQRGSQCAPAGLRIAHLLGSASTGGAERMVVNLLNALAPLRPVLILTRSGDSEPLLEELDSRVEVVRSPCRLSHLPRDIAQLASKLRQRRIDVLHAHMFWPNLFAALAASLSGVPVFVTTEHGRNPWKRSWHRWLERNVIARRAGLRLCVSADIRDVRMKSDGIPARKLTVLPNGTPIPPGRRAAMKTPVRLLAVGRLIDAKDYPTMLEAAQILRSRGLEFRLRIAGEGPLLADLQRATTAANLDSHVQWLGNRRDISALMADSDVFAISSVSEGLPMVVLEAMAEAMPIVATNIGGIPAAVTHEQDALLVPPGNAEALANAVARLIRDPQLAQAIGERARARAQREYSIEAVARRHLDCYQTLMEGYGRDRP